MRGKRGLRQKPELGPRPTLRKQKKIGHESPDKGFSQRGSRISERRETTAESTARRGKAPEGGRKRIGARSRKPPLKQGIWRGGVKSTGVGSAKGPRGEERKGWVI